MKHPSFAEIITTEEQFRSIMGHPGRLLIEKVITRLDGHCRAFIAQSPFVLLASSDAEGNLDISPKGDPPGFVQVLDDQTLAIPDRPGNRRADTFRNLLGDDHLGLIFLVPGKQETLRVSGRAMIVRDLWLRESMTHQGKVPDFALVVTVEKAFFHCGKCVIRSKLWEPKHWPDIDGVPSLARALVDHAKPPDSVEELQAMIDASYRDRLY